MRSSLVADLRAESTLDMLLTSLGRSSDHVFAVADCYPHVSRSPRGELQELAALDAADP